MPKILNIRADVLKASRFCNGIWSTDAPVRPVTRLDLISAISVCIITIIFLNFGK
jgi:hypothetical protein